MAMNGNKRAVRRGEEQWRRLLEGFDGSGLSVGGFCQRRDISVANFYRWRRRIRQAQAVSAVAGAKGSAFIDAGPLDLSDSGAKTRLDLKLDLGEGWVLHLVRG